MPINISYSPKAKIKLNGITKMYLNDMSFINSEWYIDLKNAESIIKNNYGNFTNNGSFHSYTSYCGKISFVLIRKNRERFPLITDFSFTNLPPQLVGTIFSCNCMIENCRQYCDGVGCFGYDYDKLNTDYVGLLFFVPKVYTPYNKGQIIAIRGNIVSINTEGVRTLDKVSVFASSIPTSANATTNARSCTPKYTVIGNTHMWGLSLVQSIESNGNSPLYNYIDTNNGNKLVSPNNWFIYKPYEINNELSCVYFEDGKCHYIDRNTRYILERKRKRFNTYVLSEQILHKIIIHTVSQLLRKQLV
jgi:hypothetical protein